MTGSSAPGSEDTLLFEKRGGVATLTQLLRELVGSAKALELLFTGDIIDAGEALRLDLVNRVVAADALGDATRELAERLAQGPTLAYGFAKAAVYEGANRPFESLIDLEARNQKVASRSEDAREGVRAFRENRKPEFRGR